MEKTKKSQQAKRGSRRDKVYPQRRKLTLPNWAQRLGGREKSPIWDVKSRRRDSDGLCPENGLRVLSDAVLQEALKQ